jgi:hypothetical protein
MPKTQSILCLLFVAALTANQAKDGSNPEKMQKVHGWDSTTGTA